MTHARASFWIPLLLGIASTAIAGAAPQDEIAAYGCAACHDDLSVAGIREAPDLKLTVPLMKASYLEEYILGPRAVQAHPRMPDLLWKLEREEHMQATKELSAFLRGTTEPPTVAALADLRPANAKLGEQLYRTVGCVMCHGVTPFGPGVSKAPEAPAGDAAARSLRHVSRKYTTDGLATFLADPLAHRPAGLMPDMQLSRGEAADLAAYLSPPPPGNGPSAAPDQPGADTAAVLRRAGAARFEALLCVNCHAGVVDAQPKSIGRSISKVDAGCLAEVPPPGVPVYYFDEPTRDAIKSSIALLNAPRSSTQRIDHTLGAFKCTACHVRGKTGGVQAELDEYLTTSELDLGDAARRPPQLTDIGGKLRQSWIERVLFDGASVRPYMKTRMPIFGESNVAHLPALFAEVDAQPELSFMKPKGDEKRAYHDAAREMLGTSSLGCVTCHTFNAKPAPTFQGIDLTTSPDRLQERWFKEFLIAPQKLMPGVVMPESWPGGVASHDTMLGGDTDKQINAIWDYLTLGRSARDPKGIYQPRWDVEVDGKPKVYRGRSRVAGFRGIAVGFPEGIHYAFDANNGALAAIWRGEFVSVNWNGQGAGDFNPRSKARELARDVALLQRVKGTDPWPLRPTMTKEKPINPDPTYPRQHGYGFRGYHLDEGGTPTLRYALHDVLVEDCIVPLEVDGRMALRRTLTFEAKSPTSATFRALTGVIEAQGPGVHRAGNLTVTVSAGEPRLRALEEGQELLLDLDLPQGRTQLELTYDLAN